MSIEAKIIEVQLDDHSAIGLDWNIILENLSAVCGIFLRSRTYDNNELIRQQAA